MNATAGADGGRIARFGERRPPATRFRSGEVGKDLFMTLPL
jgi:hypothetical protein